VNTIEPTPKVGKVIDVFADVVCPFTHVGLSFLASYREEFGRSDVLLRIRAWPLELVNGEPLGRELLAEEIAELRAHIAPDLFAGFDPALFPMTSLPALALAARAYRVDLRRGEQVSMALRKALFEEGRNISDPGELGAIARAFDLSPPEAEDEVAVRADWDDGKARGVIGSPHFFVGQRAFFCPSLEIERVDGHLHIAIDRTAFSRFVDHCFETDRR
jgi:predicted DsbA family dithiol-disulfide isomerase